MKNKKRKEISFRHIIIIAFVSIILMILIILLYNKMIKVMSNGSVRLNREEIFAKENENHIFRISKIILHSNVDIVDRSEQQSLQNINISQYTDISIYIYNKNYIKDLTQENTVSELYIDNIKIETLSSNGEKIINYKNPYLFGKYRTLSNAKDKIRFNILNDNESNREEQYDNPMFYTDCSNPISLGYINKDVVTNYYIRANDAPVTLNGSMLKRANIGLDVLSSNISFCVHLKNNLNEEFICNVNIDNNLDNEDGGIYTGYMTRIFDISNEEFNFIKLID